MGGKAAMQELVNIDLTMKAMVLSGYSDDEATCDHERYGLSGTAPKPYDISQLSEILQEVVLSSQGQ